MAKFRSKVEEIEAVRIDAAFTIAGGDDIPVTGLAGDYLVSLPGGGMGFLSPLLFEALYESGENGAPEGNCQRRGGKVGRRAAPKSRRPFGQAIKAIQTVLASGPKNSGTIYQLIIRTDQSVKRSSVYSAIYAGLKKGLWKREPSGQYRLNA